MAYTFLSLEFDMNLESGQHNFLFYCKKTKKNIQMLVINNNSVSNLLVKLNCLTL